MKYRHPAGRITVNPDSHFDVCGISSDLAKLSSAATSIYGEELFARRYGVIVPAPAERVVAVEDGFGLRLAERVPRFYDTPGHARHHCCIMKKAAAFLPATPSALDTQSCAARKRTNRFSSPPPAPPPLTRRQWKPQSGR
jgi:hypothetical protein